MKVAVYSGTIPSTTFVEHLINGLGANGVEVLLFGKYTKSYKPSSPNIKVYAFPVNKFGALPFVGFQILKLILSNYKNYRKFLDIMKEEKEKSFKERVLIMSKVLPILLHKPDVFHVQWAKSIEDYYWVKSVLDTPIVLSLRGGQINYSPVADQELANTFRKFFPKVDYFHGVSEAIVKEAVQYGLNVNKAVVIRPAVQKELLEKPLKEIVKKDTISILSVGRFHWKKGYHFALDAMKILKMKSIDFHYTIVAGGEHEEIIFQIHSLGLEKNVSIVKGLPHKEVLAKMQNADVFLLPSVEEGIANVVLEAMAAGTPVITTNCGGMEEVVKDQYNGFLVPVRDPEAIANSLELFKSLPIEKLQQMRKNARQTIVQNHLVDNQISAFKSLYQKVYSQNLY